MSNRHVTFQISPPSRGSPKGYRSHETAHDSGVGSSSSDRASVGGRHDRRFTAEDYEDQFYNVGALQEALSQANKKVEYYQKKYVDLDTELTKAHRVARDTEKLYREEVERNERLQRTIKSLEEERDAAIEQIKELKADYDEMRDERDEYRQLYHTAIEPVIDSNMRGGSGEPSSPRLRRSTSKHDKDRRGTARRYADCRDEKTGSSRHHRRSSSVSINPGASIRSSSKRPYIEKMPSPPSRHSGNYTTYASDPLSDPALYSTTPRGSHTTTQAAYHGVADTGNYVPYPLHERGRRRA
ncbi:hypothetical protein F5B19DRAFT_494722 [Rostrohypoxylon terebratum]|nr:hypothetical protein F5B19DRAFT_494722 [Rostrohypoxylon terebratum]